MDTTFGTSSLNNTADAFGSSKAKLGAAPTSLLDAMRRGGSDLISSAAVPIPRSPSHGARGMRAPSAKESSSGSGSAMHMPSASLRDSPYMRAAGARSTLTSTPAAASAASARLSTPFASDASPIRPLGATPAAAASKPLTDESKEAGLHMTNTPARASAGLFDTPFASPAASAAADSWGSSVATPAQPATASSSALVPAGPPGLSAAAVDRRHVTVFGFSPCFAGRVLSRFLSLGEVLSREDGASEPGAPATANWVHILYRTPLAASMAIALNGKIVEGVCMVGVKYRSNDSETNGTRAGLQTPAAERKSSIFERSARKAIGPTLAPSELYAQPQTGSMQPPLVRKSACTKIMEYFFFGN